MFKTFPRAMAGTVSLQSSITILWLKKKFEKLWLRQSNLLPSDFNLEQSSSIPLVRKSIEISLRGWSFLLQAYTVWLFTFSDLKTIVGPSSAFGSLSALAAPVFGICLNPTWWEVAFRVPFVIFWTWINLLPFTINNQRQPEAIEEDGINKPWRPMPSKKIDSAEAVRIMFASRLLGLVASIYLGGLKHFFILIFLDCCYNAWNGADSSCIIRNLINACGFVCYTSGAMEVALGSQLSPKPTLVTWFAIIAAIIFSTVQTQDMYDQAGDSLRGRQTVPLVIGDNLSRWSIAIPMLSWSWFVPWFWSANYAGYTAPAALGAAVAYRTLTKRTINDDKSTFRLWNAWLVSLYILPLVSFSGNLDVGVVVSGWKLLQTLACWVRS